MMDNTEINRARFDWGAFWRTLVVWIVDFFCAAGAVAVVWYFVRHCVFDGDRIPTTVHEVSEVLHAIAWPIAIVVLTLLFRNPLLRILNELPTLIKKSYYRHGNDQGALVPDDKSEELSKNDQVAATNDAPDGIRFQKDAADTIGKLLARKYGGRYYLERCIGNRRYIFDAVVETPSRLFGIELKSSREVADWSDTFHRVQLIYQDCPEAIKNRFVFVPVVMDEEMKTEVERMAVNFEFKTAVEKYRDEQ